MNADAGRDPFDDLVLGELAEMAARPPLTVELPPVLAFGLISQLQLAFRHPDNTGPGRRQAEAFVESLRGRLCAPGSAVDVVIMMGADPRFDR